MTAAEACAECRRPGASAHHPAPVLVVCPHGDMAWVTPAAVGESCKRDGKATRPATADEAAARGLTLTIDERSEG